MGKREKLSSNRAGSYAAQVGGYRAFVPKPLPPEPAIVMDDEMIHLLSLADRATGRLDGSTDNIPDPNFFVRMYVVKEAGLSSQIEGTQATFNDALEAQAEVPTSRKRSDVDEIFNHIDAMNYGLERLRGDDFPLSLRLICGIHERLLQGVRGENRQPGQFRQNQNWIGPEGCTLETATFVPPPVNEMNNALGSLEKFLHDDRFMPVLIKAALIHAQFETIHPFVDGNGRIGRLLITFFLCQQKILSQPLLYISRYFKRNRLEYCDRLQAVHDSGDWEGWVKFFLRGVYSVAQDASKTARKIIALREKHRGLIQSEFGSRSNAALTLLDGLFTSPIVSVKNVVQTVGVVATTANTLLKKFVEMGILAERPKRKRNRFFRYQEYLNLFIDELERS